MKKFRKELSIVLTVLLTVFTVVSYVPASAKAKVQTANPTEELKGNMWIQTTKKDFEKGTTSGTVITKDGDGAIKLIKSKGSYTTGGVYTSETINMPAFEYLVLSWNADTPKGTSITIEGQVRVNGTWSNWRSWGTWSSSMDKASSATESSEDSDVAFVDVDTLTVKGSNGETADSFRYRLTLNTNDPKATPSVRLIAATLRNTLPGQAISKVYNDGISQDQLDNLDKTIDVPVYSQMVRDPSFASYICSATSIAMLLKYRGVDILPEQSAMGTYDSVYDGYGNWPFSTAYAGSYGYTSYVEYDASMDDLKREIIKGNPVAISVKYRNDESVEKSYPVVHGAPIPSTGGHLVVVCGFTKIDGKDYVVVNDSAAANDSGVRLNYLQDEFDAAWATSGRVAYIVHPAVKGDRKSSPNILQATFHSTGETKDVDGKKYMEYKLICKGQKVNLDKAVDPDNPYYEKGISIMYKVGNGEYQYMTPTTDTTLWFDTTNENGTYEFFIFKKTGDSYKAKLDWVNP